MTTDGEPCGAHAVTEWIEGTPRVLKWCWRVAGACPFVGAQTQFEVDERRKVWAHGDLGSGAWVERPCAVRSTATVLSEHTVALLVTEVLGEALMQARLALAAIDLAETEADLADPFDREASVPDLTETQGILAALCAFLVEAGAVDPIET